MAFRKTLAPPGGSKIYACLWLLFAVVCWASPGADFSLAGQPVPVFVSIPPQKYFVEKIGGNLVSVSVMVPPGANPHIYEPRPTQMSTLSKSKIYFAIGVTFETVWLPKFAKLNPQLRIVHTDKDIDKLAMIAHHHEEEEGVGEQGKEEQDHRGESPGTLDPHVWVAPPEVRTIARNILEALMEIDPSNSGTYQSRYEAFLKEIDTLDQDLQEIFKDKQGFKFMVYHPAWGYFARAYGLEQIPVEMEGKEPKPAQLKALITQAKKDGVKIVFVQPQFSTKSAETIAKAIGGQVIAADNLREDWEKNLRVQAQKFKQSLTPKNQ